MLFHTRNHGLTSTTTPYSEWARFNIPFNARSSQRRVVPDNCTITDTQLTKTKKTTMWANAQRDDRPAEHRWRPLFNAAKFG